MQFLMDLWLPILVGGVAVFILSSLVWTVMPHHKKEWGPFPNESAVRDAIRASNLGPGLYHFPHAADMKEMGSPEMLAKMQQGPIGFVTLMPNGQMAMGPMMVKSLVSNILVAAGVAYVAAQALAPDAEYLAVFRIVGTVTFMSYCFASIPDSIWFGRPWKSWILQAVDALAYGLVMGGVFGWLW
jgi:hypothetical protein